MTDKHLHRPYRVTPIGSCRIAGPLEIAAARFGFELNRSKCYGYSHSSLEAVQFGRFLQGDYHSHSDAWPMISRNSEYDVIKTIEHTPSDLYVVEISSAKQITYRGHAVQLNYLRSHFLEFFACTERSKAFWVAVVQNQTAAFLASHWGGPKLVEQRKILSDIQLSTATADILNQHLIELKNRFPRVLVVTHVNAQRPDGVCLAARDALVHLVKDATAKLGIACYDPTQMMLRLGQSFAMEANDGSFAHFTQEFTNRLADDIFLGPICDAIAKKAIAGDAQWAFSHFTELAQSTSPIRTFVGKRRLSNLGSLASKQTQTAVLELSKSEQAFQLSDYAKRGETDFCVKFICDGNADHQADLALEFGRALELLGDFNSAAKIYEYFLRRSGNREASFALFDVIQMAVPQIEINDETFGLLFVQIGFERSLQIAGSIKEVWALFELARSDKDRNSAGEIILAHASENDRIDIVHKLSNQFFDLQVFHSVLSEFISVWANEAMNNSDLWSRIYLLQEFETLLPQVRGLKRKLNDTRKAIRTQARTFASDENWPAVLEMHAPNQKLDPPIDEIDLINCRRHFAIGDYQLSEQISRALANRSPKKLSGWIVLMRSAKAMQNLEIVTVAANHILELSTDDDARYVNEAQAILQIARSAA